ncbi:phage baseplate assembly protein V [Ursidibacter sp. B-7004-1]
MTEPNRTELLRRLDNLLRLGTIAEVDYAKALVKVQSGNILTDWLPWVTFRAGTTQSWSPPTTGEQCLVLAVSGELTTAVVLVGLYTQNAPSQSPDEHCIKFADGMELKYNQASGHLTVKNCKTANIQATSSITADTPSFTCTGNVVIQGSTMPQKRQCSPFVSVFDDCRHFLKFLCVQFQCASLCKRMLIEIISDQ